MEMNKKVGQRGAGPAVSQPAVASELPFRLATIPDVLSHSIQQEISQYHDDAAVPIIQAPLVKSPLANDTGQVSTYLLLIKTGIHSQFVRTDSIQ